MTVAAQTVPPALVITDRDAIWRAVVAAAANALPPDIIHDRQETAWRIASEAIARLQAAQERRWVGTIADPCWTCQRQLSEHAGTELRCPEPPAQSPTAKLDALVAAATAVCDHSVSVLKYTSGGRVWHVVTISLGESTREDVDALAAEYGAPPPLDHIRGTHRWLQSRFEVPGTTITLNLQGAWRHLAESDDTAPTATPA